MIRQSACKAILAVLLLVATACGPSRFAHPFWIAVKGEAVTITGPGRITLHATCAAGQQLMGGGYTIVDDDAAALVAVLATYPSSADTWTIEVDVPVGASRAEGGVVLSVAYCFTTPNYPLGITTVSQQSSGGGVPFSTLSVSCPAGSVLVGGGYRTGSTGINAPLFNANVMASSPLIDKATGLGTGWQVGLAYVLQETIPTTTVYARCATQGLEARPAVIAELDATKLAYAFGWTDWEARCPSDQFTTAGGYSLVGDPLVPHSVAYTNARDEFLTWRYRALYGYQTTKYDVRPCDPNTNPHCELLSAIAACVAIPKIPFVTVDITSPHDGDYFPTANRGSGQPLVTAPVTFSATATAEDGSPLTGAALQWFVNGVPFGSGESFSKVLPAGGYGELMIKVTATGATTSASDQIKVTTGEIE